MIYKVKVDCWYKAGKRKANGNARLRRVFLIEAESCEAAMRKAPEHAEATAPMFREWVGFEAREAVGVQMPFEISP